MSEVRVCVFCGSRTHLTDEHVVPDCFQKTFEGIAIAKTPKGDKAIMSAQEIHDVCAECNNGPLSQLDQYLCDLNDKFFSRIVRPGDCIQFEYDFDLLLRMLLKIGYNVARTRKWPLNKWQSSAEYVLNGSPSPTGIRLFLQLLIPTPAKSTSLPVSPGTDEITPLPWRCDLDNVTHYNGLAFEYSMSIWSYRFFVLWEDAQAPSIVRQRGTAKWLRERFHRGSRELSRSGRTSIYASSVTVLKAVEGNPTFLDQLSKAKQLKAKRMGRASGSQKLERRTKWADAGSQ